MIVRNESEARAWLESDLGVSRETMAQLDAYAALLRTANQSQNLIAASTAGEALWVRHIADSAQLVPHAIASPGDWIDLGSGPGLPGLVAAIIEPERHFTLVESRKRRCEFLRHCCQVLGLEGRVEVAEMSLAQVPPRHCAAISARAFAPLSRLLADAQHLAGPGTLWLLPKGRNAVKELSTLPASWQKRFHVEQSLTDADAALLIGQGIPPAATPKASKGKARR